MRILNNSPKKKSQKTGAKTIFLVIRNLKNLKNVQVCSAQFSTPLSFFSLWNFLSRFIGVIRGEVGCSIQGCSDCQIRLTNLKGFTLYYARQ
jgi:hypothetical protein